LGLDHEELQNFGKGGKGCSFSSVWFLLLWLESRSLPFRTRVPLLSLSDFSCGNSRLPCLCPSRLHRFGRFDHTSRLASQGSIGLLEGKETESGVILFLRDCVIIWKRRPFEKGEERSGGKGLDLPARSRSGGGRAVTFSRLDSSVPSL
jgi:hypothetical protein